MGILEFAMQMEKDSEQFYRDFASQTENKGLRTILNMLADEERKHLSIVEEMKTGMPTAVETNILDDVKNVFVEMKQTGTFLEPEITQIQLYTKAQGMEQKSVDFYKENAEQVKRQYQKALFLKLAEEEKKHYFLFENIIEFVSRPQTWLENAEFCHLEEY